MSPPGLGPAPPKGPKLPLLILGLAAMGVGGYALFYALGRSSLDEEALLHGSIIGGVGLVFFCLWLRKAASNFVAFAVLITCVTTVGVFSFRGFQIENEKDLENLASEQFFASIAPVCSAGQTVSEAPGYLQGQENRAVFFTLSSNERDFYPSRYGVTEEFRPASLATLGLVVCTKTETRTLETCDYSTSEGPRVATREQYIRTIEVVDPSSAQVLDRQLLEGTVPSECTASRTFDQYQHIARIYGSLPIDAAVVELIRPWLEGSATVRANSAPAAGSRALAPGVGQRASGSVKPSEEPPPTGKP